MTSAEELSSLETQYSAWITAGCPKSYAINGRTVDKGYWDFLIKRIDMLRVAVARQTSAGSCPVASFRRPD
jgi:hypothetical protein